MRRASCLLTKRASRVARGESLAELLVQLFANLIVHLFVLSACLKVGLSEARACGQTPVASRVARAAARHSLVRVEAALAARYATRRLFIVELTLRAAWDDRELKPVAHIHLPLHTRCSPRSACHPLTRS